MYKTVCGLITALSDDETNEDAKLDTNNTTIINKMSAEPKNEAKNVLKNDFIFLLLKNLC